MNKQKDIPFYLKEISLVDFFVSGDFAYSESSQTGYKESPESTKGSPKFYYLKNGVKIDTVVIKYYPDGKQKYWSNSFSKGYYQSILDLVISHREYYGPKKLYYAKRYLDKYVRSAAYVHPDNSTYAPTKRARNLGGSTSVKYKANISDLSTPDYLLNRGISQDTLEHSLFKGLVNNEFRWFKETGQKEANIAFSMRDINGSVKLHSIRNTISYEVDNKTECLKWNRFSGEVGSSAFYSNNDGPLDYFYLFESAIDLLSFFQLNIDSCQSKSALYFSYEGQSGFNQHQLLQTLFHRHQPSTVVSCFDNDLSGYYYSMELALTIDFAETAAAFKPNVLFKHFGSTTIHVFKNLETCELGVTFKPGKADLNSVTEYLHTNVGEWGRVEEDSKLGHVNVFIEAVAAKLIEAFIYFSSDKYKELSMRIITPSHNDFNEDLNN